MFTRQYTIEDMQATRVDGVGYVAVTIAPVLAPEAPSAAEVPYTPLAISSVRTPLPLRVTGIPIEQTAGWSLGATLTLTLA